MRGQDISEDFTAVMINGMPKPSVVLFFRDETPHFIEFRFLDFSHGNYDIFSNKAFQERFVDGEQSALFFLSR